MGVLTLWPMLEAAREVCDLQVLSGKTLAVDLSGWICEACALRATIGKVNKPHLRTLFFRVAQLCRLDVKLVFVCDGNAVELKYETISKRIDARNGRTSGQATGSKTKKKCSRTQLNRRVKEVSSLHVVCRPALNLVYCKYTNFRQLFNFGYIRHRPKTPKLKRR